MATSTAEYEIYRFPSEDERINYQNQTWIRMFNRLPVYHAAGSQDPFLIRNNAKDTEARNLILKFPQIDNIILLGFDSEFVSDKADMEYENWDAKYKFVPSTPDKPRPTHRNYNGPFTRYVQIANLTGKIFIWDLRYFSEEPETLKFLLRHTPTNVKFFVHAFDQDNIAYYHMYGPHEHTKVNRKMQEIPYPNILLKSSFIDTQKILTRNANYLTLRNFPTERTKLDFVLQHLFRVNNPHLVVDQTAAVAQFWNISFLTQTMLQYLMLDPLGTLDLGILLFYYKYMSTLAQLHFTILQTLTIGRKYDVHFPYLQRIKPPRTRLDEYRKLLSKENKPTALGTKNKQASILIKRRKLQNRPWIKDHFGEKYYSGSDFESDISDPDIDPMDFFVFFFF